MSGGGRPRTASAARGLLAPGLLAATIALGPGVTACSPTDLPVLVSDDGPAPPAYADLATAHNRRIVGLRRFTSRGAIELHWTDEDGHRHTDQGEMDLWVQLPFQVSLRVSKLGEDYLWIGSAVSHYWLFDLTGDERVLRVSDHDDLGETMASPLPVSPLALIDLMGLTPLPESAGDEAVEFDAERDAWGITAPGLGGPMRVWMDRASLLPVRVESLSADGQIDAYSQHTLRRYRSVFTEGAAVLAWPKISTLSDVFVPGQTDFIKFALQDPTTSVDREVFGRVMDVAVLQQALRPDRIEGVLP